MGYLRFLFFLVLVSSAISGLSQNSAKIQTVEKVSVFDSKDTTLLNSGRRDDSIQSSYYYHRQNTEGKASRPIIKAGSKEKYPEDIKIWMVKFNPVLLARGQALLYMERRLGRNISLEGALGITSEDYFKKFFIQGELLSEKNPNAQRLNGMAGRASLRFFPGHAAYTGFFFAPEIDFSDYRKVVSGLYAGSGGYQDGKLTDRQKYIDFMATIGSQNLLQPNGEMYIEWYVGLGIRSGQENNVVRDDNNSMALKLVSINRMGPLLSAGIKFGLGF